MRHQSEKGAAPAVPTGRIARATPITTRYDSLSGIVRVYSTGFLEPEQIDACFCEAAIIIGRLRLERKPIRVVVDCRDAVIQSAESAERIRIGTLQLYLPADRIALLVTNSLVKLQLRRVLDEKTHRIFMDEDAGMAWLLAQDG